MSHTRGLRLDPGLMIDVGQPDSLVILQSDRDLFLKIKETTKQCLSAEKINRVTYKTISIE